MTDFKELDTVELFKEADDGSYYFIQNCGGDLQEWVDGYEKMLAEQGIGKPEFWCRAIGANVNGYAGASFKLNIGDPFRNDAICLLFPLDGLDVGKLAMFRLLYGDRWFDDVVANMKAEL